MTIKRIWHGWTTPDQADAYERLLHDEVFPGIEAKAIKGYRGIELLREDRAGEVAFATIMTFDDLDCVKAFQGPDYARCYVPDAARRLLARCDERAAHYEVIETRHYA
jgi:antibiotic biosynthesis monooxygenase (ABM) superfamily enzyme